MANVNRSYAQTTYNVSRSPGRRIQYIVIHYTATDASAQSNCQYFGSGNRQASADYFVNRDGSIFLFNGDIDNMYTWHCGDGHGRNGITNQNSIGIENVSSGQDFTSNQIAALGDLVSSLMARYGLSSDRVVRHYDASGKLCPAPYIDQGKWNALKSQITGSSGTVTGTGNSIPWDQASTTEEKVFRYLVGIGGLTKGGASGIMGNMYYESGIKPNRVQMGYGWSDDRYTSSVDSGSYGNFVHDSIGYGLVQLTYWTEKQRCYNKAKSSGKSVGDLEVQLSCLTDALSESYGGLLKTLKSSDDPRECAIAFLLQYERPANQGSSVQNKRASKAEEFYNQFKDLEISGSSSGGGYRIVIDPYTRDQPLVVEFGYAIDDTSDPNLGHQMKAQKEESNYPISAINMNNTLLDIFNIWNVNIDGGGGSSNKQVSGQAKTKSGKILTSGELREVPDSQPQTGIVANYTSYDRHWASGTNQRTLYDIWVSQGKPSDHSIATIDGYYLIAPGRYFSNNAGDILQVNLEDGTSFMCIVGDTKGSDTPSEYGHYLGGGGKVDIIEWENATSSQSSLSQGLHDLGWYGKRVVSMINYGTYFQ